MSNINVSQAFEDYRDSLVSTFIPSPELVQITVSGKGDFPMDMLRYTRSWPCEGHSAANLITPSYRETDPREVTLHLAGPDSESLVQNYAARFASFGWVITDVRVY